VKDGVAYAPRILSQHHVFVGLPSNGLRSLKFGPLLDRDDVAFRMSGAVGFDLGKMCLGQLDIRYGGNFKPEDVVAGIALLRAGGGMALTSNGDRWTLSSQSLVAVRAKSFKSLALNGGKKDG